MKDDSNNIEVVCTGEILLTDIATNMQAIRTVQRYVNNNIDKGTELYNAFEAVVMRAIEAVADIAEEKGISDLTQFEQAVNNGQFNTFKVNGTDLK